MGEPSLVSPIACFGANGELRPSSLPRLRATVGKTFGRERFGAILGLMRPAMLPIQILGVPFAGWVYDETGSYANAFEVFLCIYFLAALALSFYRQPKTNVQ